MTHDAISDLARVPHVREVILFDGHGAARSAVDGRLSDAGPLGALSRGLGQLARVAPSPLERVAIKTAKTRVTFAPLRSGGYLAVIADAQVDVPLLSLALQSAILVSFDEPATAPSPVESPSPVAPVAPVAPPRAPDPLEPRDSHLHSRPTLQLPKVTPLRAVEAAAAMNELVALARPWLGKHVLSNYLRLERGSGELPLTVDAAGTIAVGSAATDTLTAQEHAQLQRWAAGFIARCSRIVFEFPSRVREALGERATLLGLNREAP